MKEMLVYDDSWFHWKQIAGYAYVIICIFDFIIMPISVQISSYNTNAEIREMIEETENKEALITVLGQMNKFSYGSSWHPVTLISGGLFHISFGAILTGAAVTQRFNSNGNGKPKKKE